MKKKILGTFLVCMSILFIGCGFFRSKKEAESTPLQGEEGVVVSLFALADSREEAEEIAALYEITLIDYSEGVATFETGKDAQALIEWGKEKDYPVIEINHKMQAY